MAKERNLPSKSTLTTSDYIRVVGSDNASYKQLVSDVAKKTIEDYTGSSLAGSSQSVKSAVDALSDKLAGWVSVYTGTLSVGESASLSSAGRILALRFADEAGSSSTVSLSIVPFLGGSLTFFLPVAFGSTLTWARINTNSTTKTIEFISVGDASIRLKQILTVL